MPAQDFGACLGLDGYIHVVDDEIHLRAASQAPIVQLGIRFAVQIIGREFVEAPVLKGLAVQFGAGLQRAAFGQNRKLTTPISEKKNFGEVATRLLGRFLKAGSQAPSRVSSRI